MKSILAALVSICFVQACAGRSHTSSVAEVNAQAPSISFFTIKNGTRAPAIARYPGEPLAVRVDGLTANGTYQLKTQSGKNAAGPFFESHITIKADANGVFDTETMAPLSGGYSGIDIDGIFWSMHLEQGPTTAVEVMQVRIEKEGQLLQAKDIDFATLKPGVKVIDVSASGLVGKLYIPAGSGKHPAVIKLGGSEGQLVYGLSAAAALANQGYAALALAYFSEPGLPVDLVHIPVEYVGTALRYLQNRPEVDSEKIAIMGVSRGSELALLSGSVYPEIHAVIAEVPSAIRWSGNVESTQGHSPAAWTRGGKDLPHLESQGGLDWTTLPDGRKVGANAPAFERGLTAASARQVDDATSHIEATHGPILLIGGEDDQMWPSCKFAGMAKQRLDAKKHPYADEFICIPGAGHGVTGLPGNPSGEPYIFHPQMKVWVAMGGTPVANARGQRQAWDAKLKFLEKTFGAP